MRAARVHKPGPPDVIVVEDIDLPEPREQEVLVRIYAAGVGPLGRVGQNRQKSDLPQKYPLTLGSEISGVVEKIGPITDEFTVGCRLLAAAKSLGLIPIATGVSPTLSILYFESYAPLLATWGQHGPARFHHDH
jgi:NADPH:quinone reductase-like Zn-dependent oxidoreductase